MSAPGDPDEASSTRSWPPPAPRPTAPNEPTFGPRPVPYGQDPYAAPTQLPNPPEQPVFDRADFWTVILGTIGVLLVGVVATIVWVWLAPRATAIKEAGGGAHLANPETKAFAGADVTFLFVTLAAGLLCAVVAAIVARHRGLAVTVAMAGGGLLSSLMVAWCGRWLTGGPIHHWATHTSTGAHQLFIQLQTRPFLMAWPVAALVVTFIVALATQARPGADASADPSAPERALR